MKNIRNCSFSESDLSPKHFGLLEKEAKMPYQVFYNFTALITEPLSGTDRLKINSGKLL
jgi:hypothetical protein